MIFKVSKSDKNKIGVYCITNEVNGKIYIGSTGNSFYTRYSQHVADYKKGKHNGVSLKRAFDKYGIDNFSFTVVCVCSKDERLVMEQFYIDKGTDYNSALIAGSMLGYRHPDTSKTRTVRGGIHHTAKKVYQFSMTGQLIKEFGSVIEALTSLGKTKNGSSHITQSCIGNTYSAFGYRWSFKPKVVERTNRKGKHKVSVEKDGVIRQFESQVDAANFIRSTGTKCNQGRINRSLNTGEIVYGFKINKI